MWQAGPPTAVTWSCSPGASTMLVRRIVNGTVVQTTKALALCAGPSLSARSTRHRPFVSTSILLVERKSRRRPAWRRP
ncbi:hypothetical protein ACLVWQ_22350 [Streptomyces sp. CWNU-52B]|uniref:hypothetical protein n=1 Tax=unclassified Streptomyces TaxID=2593676 RepID=UPI0039C4942A